MVPFDNTVSDSNAKISLTHCIHTPAWQFVLRCPKLGYEMTLNSKTMMNAVNISESLQTSGTFEAELRREEYQLAVNYLNETHVCNSEKKHADDVPRPMRVNQVNIKAYTRESGQHLTSYFLQTDFVHFNCNYCLPLIWIFRFALNLRHWMCTISRPEVGHWPMAKYIE